MKTKNKKKVVKKPVKKKLNKAFKAKWLKALRSGRYEQTCNVLRDDFGNNRYGYCCLGVACNIMDRHWSPFGNAYINKYSNNSFVDLSDEFKKQINLSDRQQSKLIRMNDAGKSFKEIADYIERYL